MIKTKIIATMGPATSKAEVIRGLKDAGVDVFRLNFSHGTLDEHGSLLRTIRETKGSRPLVTAVMGDLCGPKIRTSRIEPTGVLEAGSEVVVEPGLEVGTVNHFGTNYQGFYQDVSVGDRVLLDDGQLLLRVKGKRKGAVVCAVEIGGELSSRKGMNLPDTKVSASSLTEKDWQCVDWAVEHDLDFLAMSFVRRAEEIIELKNYLQKKGSSIRIVAKIEKPQAVGNLEEIVAASDGVLVARGDLGVEMPLCEVPIIQKRITGMCQHYGKPVIVATQMLQSMIEHATATRAEVSDVANAIMDLTDAVMLSGETSVGKYPIEAVQTINKVASVTELYLERHAESRPKMTTTRELISTAAIARSVAQIVEDIGAKLVVAWSQTGSGARLLSKSRIDVPVVAFSSDEQICRQMCLHYGVLPLCQAIPSSLEAFVKESEAFVQKQGWVQTGDTVIYLAGRPLTPNGSQNTIIVHTLGGV